jgi:hypothetical protein
MRRTLLDDCAPTHLTPLCTQLLPPGVLHSCCPEPQRIVALHTSPMGRQSEPHQNLFCGHVELHVP